MLSPSDQQLFLAARRAQVTRNIAMAIFNQPNASELIAGVFVRILVELPSGKEDYVIARVQSLEEGEPYGGFAGPTQESSKYLLLNLPDDIALINGVRYQLNSVSNTGMNEAEFQHWLNAMRPSSSEETISVSEFAAVAERVRSVETTRPHAASHPPGGAGLQQASMRNLRRSTGQQLPGANNAAAAAVPPSMVAARAVAQQRPQPQLPVPQATEAPAGHARTGSHTTSLPSPTAAVTVLPPVTHSLGTLEPHPKRSGRNAESGGAAALRLSSPLFPAHGPSNHPSRSATPRSNASPGAVVMNNNTNATGGTAAAAVTNNSTTTVTSSAGVTSPATANGAPSTALGLSKEEDEELNRRIRQDIINRLSQDYVLFQRNTDGLKLTRLRLLERDMNEYLQHVHAEISSRQVNCVACMDRISTVITMPCRHKVLCRFCAPAVAVCPICRAAIEEMFEVEEV